MDKKILYVLQAFLIMLLIVYVIGSLYHGTFSMFDWPQENRKIAAAVIVTGVIFAFLNIF